eukprot:gene312-3681_t
MVWGNELWDQEAEVMSYIDQNAEFMLRCRSFIQARSQLELSFAKDLQKLVEKYKTEAEKPDIADDHRLCYLLDHAVLISICHVSYEILMHEKCSEPLRELASEQKNSRKKASTNLSQAKKAFQDIRSKYEAAKKQYDKTYREYSDANNKLKRLGETGTNSKSKVEKLRQDMNRLHHEADATRSEYNLLRDELNKAQSAFFHEQQADILNNLQIESNQREKTHRDVLRLYAGIQEQILPVIGQCIQGMKEALDSVDADRDAATFANNFRTGNPIPEDEPEYDPAKGSMAIPVPVHAVHSRRVKRPNIFKSTSRRKNTAREDFSHLPPEQRRKAIQKRVSSLQEEHATVCKSMNAIIKTIEIYKQQPQFGDERALAKAQKEVDDYGKHKENLAVELYKFQLYLSALVGLPLPDPPEGYKGQLSSGNILDGDNVSVSSFAATSTAPSSRTYSVVSKKISEDDDFEDDAAEDFDHQQQEEQHHNHVDTSNAHISNVVQELPIIAVGVALYPFPGTNDGELPLEAGERVELLEDDGSGWARILKHDQQGYVPRAYLQVENNT